MKEIFKGIPKIAYEGAESKNPLAFKFYDADKVVLGKKMSEHLPFAMAWWHNLCANGVDMFGRGTADKSFGAEAGTMAHAKAKVDAGFEFMQKLGIRYFCFHDVDLVPEADDIKETNRRLDEISDYILEKMKGTDIKCLWGTANMFGNPRFMNGAGSTNSADVYAFAAAQVKKALDGAPLPDFPCPVICGVGGTIRGAGKLCNYLYKLPAGNRTITLNMVDGLLERFSAPAKADLQILLKIVPERVHTLLPGLVILSTLAHRCRGDAIEVSSYGVREGFLLTEVLKRRSVTV